MEGDFYGKGASTYRGACGGRAARPADRGRAAPSQPAAQSPHVPSYHLIGRGCCSTLPPAVSEVLLPPRCTYTHKGGCPTLPLDKTHSQVVEAVKFVLMVQFQLSFRRKCENLNDLVVIILFSSSSSSSSGGGGNSSSSSSSGGGGNNSSSSSSSGGGGGSGGNSSSSSSSGGGGSGGNINSSSSSSGGGGSGGYSCSSSSSIIVISFFCFCFLQNYSLNRKTFIKLLYL